MSTSLKAIHLYAIKRSQTEQTIISIVYRETAGEYIALGPNSDIPENVTFVGSWVWDGQGSNWNPYAANEST